MKNKNSKFPNMLTHVQQAPSQHCQIHQFTKYLLVSELVGDGVGYLQASILVDITRAKWLTHACDLRHPERGTPVRDSAAYVVSGEGQHR